MSYFLLVFVLAVSAQAQLPQPLEVPFPDGMVQRSRISRLGPDEISRLNDYPIVIYGRAVSARVFSKYSPDKGGPPPQAD